MVKFPVRIKCATLSWNTLAQGLDEAEAIPPTRPAPERDVPQQGVGLNGPGPGHAWWSW